MAVYNFLETVNITFDALQVESGIVARQYENLAVLLMQLQQHCTAERDESCILDAPVSFSNSTVSKGQFSVSVAGIELLLQGIDVDAAELAAEIEPLRKMAVLASCAVLYLEAMSGVVKVMAGRQAAGRESAPAPPCLPLQLANTSMVDFVSLVASHKEQLRAAFGPEFIPTVCRQHKDLIRISAQEPPLMASLQSTTRNAFTKAWSPCGSRFAELQQFAAGLATVMPTTSRVEGDFSLMSYRRNAYCAAMTDFVLEGIIYAKQYRALQDVANRL